MRVILTFFVLATACAPSTPDPARAGHPAFAGDRSAPLIAVAPITTSATTAMGATESPSPEPADRHHGHHGHGSHE